MTSFVDISSIPPLPLYCLLAADTDSSLSAVIERSTAGEMSSFSHTCYHLSNHKGHAPNCLVVNVLVVTAGNPATSNKEGYDELFTGVYDPNHDDLDLRLSDSDDDEDSDSKPRRRHSSAVAPRSRYEALTRLEFV